MSGPGPAGRRVVVTGLGAVSSVGIGVRAFTDAVRAGRVGTSEIRSFDPAGFPSTRAGEVHDFAPGEILRTLDPARWGRSALFAASAARLGVEDAGLDPDELGALPAGSAMGTTSGESAVIEALTAQWVSEGLKEIDAELVRQVPATNIANAVNVELGIDGDAQTIATACSASNYALGYGYDLVRSGEAELMISGGADSVNRWAHAGFERLGALSPSVCRPFDAERSGILTAEGGVALVLESLDRALARGAPIYAEMLGYGVNCDARHPVAPDADSIAECIRLAHEHAGVRPADVDYICAHGTGTPTNDAVEVAAVRAVFGDRPPPISSIKSMIGHTMGAASGFGATACCLALREGFLPPTANVEEVDPDLGAGLDVVTGSGRPSAPRVAQNHGFAFGGNNAITIFGGYR